MSEYIKYHKVNLINVIPDDILGFDIYVYLPSRNKYLKYINADDQLDQDKLKKLSEKNVEDQLFVKEEDLEKYNEYMGKIVTQDTTENSLSEKERIRILIAEIKKAQETIRTIKDDSEAISWAENCLHIIDELGAILADTDISSVFDKFKEYFTDKFTLEDHSAVVSGLSMVLGVAVGLTERKLVTDLALGGLLHDIGFLTLEPELLKKYLSKEEMNDEELKTFQLHATKGKDLVSKIVKSPLISDNVVSIIYQHHENNSESGFPNKLSILKLTSHVKVVAIADKLSKDIHTGDAIDLRYSLFDLFQEQNPISVKEFDTTLIKQLYENI